MVPRSTTTSSPLQVPQSIGFLVPPPTVLHDHNGAAGEALVASCSTNNNHGRNLASSVVGPATLLGGSAVIYSAVLRHPSSTLTPLSLVYMLLLALQYSIQPRLSKKHIDARTSKDMVALVEEVVKTLMAAAVWQARRVGSMTTTTATETTGWSIGSSLTVAGVPAALYALQGVLTYTAFCNLDAVTFNGLTQTKTLSAAFWCWCIMGQRQSALQLLALGMLFASALIFHHHHHQSNNNNNNNNNSMKVIKGSKEREEEWFSLGIVPCLGATCVSGLAGAFSQKGLQLTGGTGRDPFLYTMEVSFFSAVCLLLSILRKQMVRRRQRQQQPQNEPNNDSFFAHWNSQTLIPIVIKAAGGVLTALVHKHAGSVVKGFALMFGLVLSGIIQSILLVDDDDTRSNNNPSWNQIAGTLLVMLSSWLHFTNPPR